MVSKRLSFEELPDAVSYLISKVDSIEKTLLSRNEQIKESEDQWFNIDELREYLSDHPAKATIYGWVSTRQIPHHKGEKKLRFLKSEIDKWLLNGKRKSEDELQTEAANYLNGKKGGRSYE